MLVRSATRLDYAMMVMVMLSIFCTILSTKLGLLRIRGLNRQRGGGAWNSGSLDGLGWIAS